MRLQTKIGSSAGTANTQCKSLKSLAKGHGPRTYIILDVGKVTGHKFRRDPLKKYYHIHAWSNLSQWFLRRSKCEKLTAAGWQTPSDGKSSLEYLALVS